jgi:chromosome segregation ATPase
MQHIITKDTQFPII